MASWKEALFYTDLGQVVLCSVMLVLTCLLGDLLCSATSQSQLLWRALADSATHSAVGLLSWAVVVTPGLSLDRWMQCLLSGFLASVIDVDHFLQAGSFELKAAVSLQHRPAFHSTTLVLTLTALLWIVSLVLRLSLLKKVTLMCLVAWLSHHLRDASRRGLWFPPFGSTPPVPYAVYIIGTVALSVVAHYGYSVCCKVPYAHERIVDLVPTVLVDEGTPVK